MDTIFFYIPMKLPDENQLHKLLKTRKAHVGSEYPAFRKTVLHQVGFLILDYFQKAHVTVPCVGSNDQCRFRFDWYEQDRRRDPDNITAGGRKIILDAMRQIGMIQTDGWKLYRAGEVSALDIFHEADEYGVHVSVELYQLGEEFIKL